MHDQSHILEGAGDVVKIKAYLRVPKVCTHMVSLLAKLQRDHFMHSAIKICVVIERRQQSMVKAQTKMKP